ncbi:hypothetical protein FGIG_02003 [Fasciola gigantica]|uniref:VWFD domain-containing protein n=1 Tax=Fasciola gigantica TaxID=46835 RepID=A0A504YJQ4_FASGI|nr:hypothetical protein FGIG_02003 [Fasciola gigantica]
MVKFNYNGTSTGGRTRQSADFVSAATFSPVNEIPYTEQETDHGAVINSQHFGYWTGYEMATTMTRYELSGLETKDKERKLTVRSIMGVRLLEGRGTRAFESGFQVSISPQGDQFLIQLKAGQPGRTRDNSMQFQYSMGSTRPFVSLELTLFSVKECFIQSEISYDPSGRFGGALLEFIVPRLNASNRMKITRKHDLTELLVVSQDETHIDAPMILSEKFPTDPSSDPEIVTCSFSGNPSNGVQQTPILFSYSVWKTNSQKSIRALNMSLNFGLDGGTSKHIVNLGISSGGDSTDSNQIYVRTTYPWAIEASISFGQKMNKGCVYRHNIHQLSKDGDLSWTSRADCSIDTFYSTSCGLSYLSQTRIFNASLDGRPDQGIYQTELAWDRSHNGMIQTMVKGFRSIYLRTPLRQIELNLQSKELKPTNKSAYVLTNYTFATSDPESHRADRDFYSTLLVYQLTDRTDDQRNWTYGAKLLSSMLSRESVECNLTIQSAPDQLSFDTNLFTGDQLDHKINLQLTSDEAQEDVVQSKLRLKSQDNEYNLIGLHVLRSSYMTSELTLSHPISWASAGRWNITIDSWNQFQLTNFNETKISSHTWRNNTHGVLQQIVFVNSGLLNMSHLSSLQLSPFHLDSILDSRSGRAWITGRKTGAREFLIDTEHSPSGADWSVPNRRKDLVARFLLDPENTFHVNLNWRPGLINEILLHGTELSDVESVKLLLQNPVPVASTVRELLAMFSDENSASLFSHRDLKAWWKVSVSDFNRMFTTIQRWWKDDQFYLRTLKVPVIEKLGEFNVTDFAHNITSFRAILLDEIGRILQKAAEDDLFRLEQLEELKLKIERNRFPLFKPTFEAMARMTSGVIWASGQFANFLFYKVAACTNAVYTLKQSLRAWIDHQYTWMSNLSQTPFAVQLGAFLNRLQVDVPALRPIGCFCNTMMESVTALVRQLIHYVQRLALGAITEKEVLELLTMMSTGHVENASQLFFKPHLTRFTADLENGLVKLSVHVPKLFEKLIGSAFGSQSYPRQILSWIYPSRGMKSIMYAYDQYQHNFEAMRKLVHLIPPYKVTSWLMIDSENNAYVVTFNGLFIPVKKPHWGPYLLVANTDQDRKLRVIHKFADLTKEGGWRTKITIGSMTIYVTHEGQRELISILFDVRLRYLRVQLDGAWHGQCRGLLGSNDFEQMHETLDPRTGRMWNQSDMARLWSYTTVGENTTDKLQATVGSRLPSRSSNWCNDMWQRFQPCFADVNPDPWIEACDYSIDLPRFSKKTDAKGNRVEWNDRSCMVARAYIHSCNLQDVPVRVPHQCVSCERNDEKDVTNILPQDNFHANTRRITFVIEMGSCFDRRRKEIVELLILLNKSKQSQPVQYSAFLFTSLSGTTETTRLTSNNGFVWMSGDQFLQTLGTFDQQKDVSLWEQRTSEFVEWPRATEALSKAIRQPAGSAGSHDSVLLYICSGCTPEGSQYKTLIRVIKRKGIDFHYIPESSFTTVGDLHRNVFLLTSDEHYDKLLSDGSIRRVVNSGTVNAPRDHCSLIAQGSEGLIWAYQNVATTKQRLRAIITSMASHLSRPIGMQRQCVCRDNLYGAGVLDCSVSLNKTAENVKLMPII